MTLLKKQYLSAVELENLIISVLRPRGISWNEIQVAVRSACGTFAWLPMETDVDRAMRSLIRRGVIESRRPPKVAGGDDIPLDNWHLVPVGQKPSRITQRGLFE